MIAARIVDDVRSAGATLAVKGDQLHVDAPKGALTAGHKAALKSHKAEVLDFLAGHDDPLLGALVTSTAGLPVDAADAKAALSQADIADWHAGRIGADHLRAFALAMHDSRERNAGRIPDSYEDVASCAQCGPVWLFTPGDVPSCPWCRNRTNGQPIPRPHAVTCATCQYFTRSEHPNLGHCAAGVRAYAPAGLWDTDKHACMRWLPLKAKLGGTLGQDIEP